jgi:hypothetical protein
VPGADEADAEQEVGPPPAPAPAQRTDAEIAGEKWARTTRTWAWLSLFVWPVLFGIFWRLFSAPAALTHEARRALGHAWALAMTALVLAMVGVACLLLL